LVSANTAANQGWYVTNDGGLTWNGDDGLPRGSGGAYSYGAGDPSTAFDAEGRGYLVTMAPTVGIAGPDGYLIQRTDDFGSTWSDQRRGEGPAGGFDKEMAATFDEMQPAATANNFYCAWTDFGNGCKVRFNRSVNGGLSFANEQYLSTKVGKGSNVQTGPNGEVYVCWADYINCSTEKAKGLGFAYSNDGGVNFTVSLPFSYSGIEEDCICNAANCPADNHYNNTRVSDFPSMAVDKSCGDYRGRIYVAFPVFDPANGNRTIVNVRYSDDHGQHWTEATTVSIPTGRRAFDPWIAVDDATGLVNVAYQCFDQATGFQTNTYLAYSYDGGSTWHNSKVSSQSFIREPVTDYQATFCTGYAGDYIGLASFQGKSYVGWCDNRSGNWQVYVSRVDFPIRSLISSSSNLVINHPPVLPSPSLYQASNQISVATNSKVSVNSTANVEMKAGNSIVIAPGSFNVHYGATFLAHIAPFDACNTPGAVVYKQVSPQDEAGGNLSDHSGPSVFYYPNPSSEFISIGLDNPDVLSASLDIYDLTGKKVYEHKVTVSDKSLRHILNVLAFPDGLYCFKLQTEKQSYSGKFIVTKK
jgi:hypothetical protein